MWSLSFLLGIYTYRNKILQTCQEYTDMIIYTICNVPTLIEIDLSSKITNISN